METLETLGDAGLMFVLELKEGCLQISSRYQENAGVIAACVLEAISQPYSAWYGLSQSGLFDGFFRRWTEKVAWTDLNQVQQQRLLVETHQMVEIPAGVFWMREDWRVRLTRPFAMGKYPVTQGLWQSIIKEPGMILNGASRPIDRISARNCFQFCNKLSKREGFEPVYSITTSSVLCDFDADGYRLPTEAEWTYAAKAGDPFRFSGNDNIDEVAWYEQDRWRSSPRGVGQKNPNGFGLYDMSGNVFEWCWDLFDISLPEDDIPKHIITDEVTIDPIGTSNSFERTRRGGSYQLLASSSIVFNRYYIDPDYRDNDLGFRLVRSSL